LAEITSTKRFLNKGQQSKQTTPIDLGKSPFLTIQLLPQFGFGHQTSKLDIFDHLTLKTVHNWPSNGFDGWF
jgi:hypothetical protein